MDTVLGKKIGIGANADVYEYGDGKLVKLFNSLDHARGIQSEFNHTLAAWQCGLPVPRPYEIVEINGLPGLVLEYIEGQTLASRMDGDDTQNALRLLARLQFQLHSVPAKQLKAQDFFTVKDSISWQINNHRLLSATQKEAVMAKLVRLPEGRSLCHGDLHMLNVIMRGEEAVVIDWQGAAIGHPAYDVMQLLVILRYVVIPGGMLPQEFIDNFYATRKEMETAFLDEYRMLSGMDADEIEAWLAPCAAARLWADICDEERQNVLSALIKAIA
jgi:uncharacterized protein (TIGR02172 family)